VNREVFHRLDRIEALLHVLIKQEFVVMTDLSKLTADIAAETDFIKSAQAAFAGLAQQIADLKGQVSQDPDTQAAIDALAQQVEANNAALSAAIPANTPAAPTDAAPASTDPAAPAA
jgi:uncharacterized protein involved in exopolysaccharide biosynthesis